MTKWVVDANLFIDWVVFADQRDLPSLHFLDEFIFKNIELHAPEFVLIETMNVLKTKYRYQQTEVETAIKYLRTLGINFWSSNTEEWQELLQTAYKFALTVYDAHYVLVAAKIDAKVMTKDRDILACDMGISMEDALKDMVQ